MVSTRFTLRLFVGSIVAAGALSCLSAQAQTYNLFIQPIQVRTSDGASGAPLGSAVGNDYFQKEIVKIFAQANINVFFKALNTYNNDLFTTTDEDSSKANSFDHLVDDAGHGQNADPTVIDLFFVNNLTDSTPGTLFGLGRLGSNGIVINGNATTSFNNGAGRIDTVAHELGHNFGLDHNSFGAGASSPGGVGANNLMTSGSNRNTPNTIGDITPDGLKLDILTTAQVTEARRVGLANGFLKVAAVPEPGAYPMAALLAFSGAGFLFKRRRSQVA